MIIKNGLDQEDEDEGVEEESDSDSGLGSSVPPCSVIFIGANVSTGKSSIKLRPRDKKVCTQTDANVCWLFSILSFNCYLAVLHGKSKLYLKLRVTFIMEMNFQVELVLPNFEYSHLFTKKKIQPE